MQTQAVRTKQVNEPILILTWNYTENQTVASGNDDCESKPDGCQDSHFCRFWLHSVSEVSGDHLSLSLARVIQQSESLKGAYYPRRTLAKASLLLTSILLKTRSNVVCLVWQPTSRLTILPRVRLIRRVREPVIIMS